MKNNIYPFEKPEFGEIRLAAYKLILAQRDPHIGMRAENIIIPNKKLVFDTIQNYSLNTGKSISDLTENGKILLGCHINFYDKLYLLLHNEAIYSFCCENWTNLHEIGHIQLLHDENGDKEEVEAHFFAACFAMPDAVLRYIKSHGHSIDKFLLMDYFKVSAEAAEKKITTLNICDYETPLDEKIIHALLPDIRFILRDLNRKCSSLINLSFFN